MNRREDSGGSIHAKSGSDSWMGLDVPSCDNAKLGQTSEPFVTGLSAIASHRFALRPLLGLGMLAALGCGMSDLEESRTTPAPDGLNVLLIVVDTLRADVLECYGGEARTPNICGLAERGTLFERAYSNSPWTYPSAAAMFTSQPSSRWEVEQPIGAADARPSGEQPFKTDYRIPDTEPLLTSDLAELGYDVVGRIENPIALQAGALRGLVDLRKVSKERLVAPSKLEAPEESRLFFRKGSLHEISFSQRFLAHPLTATQPFFLLHWFNGPHAPYDPTPQQLETLDIDLEQLPHPLSHYTSLNHVGAEIPKEKQMGTLRQGTDDEVKLVKTLYLLQVESVDHRIGLLLETLANADLADRTLVILTADHGEGFREHGSFLHGHGFYDEQVWIPLIMAGPNVVAGLSVSQPVSLLDLVPTLREALDLPRAAADTGISLLDYSEGQGNSERSIYLDGGFRPIEQLDALVSGNLKLFTSRRKAPFLFDIEADPTESSNLAKEMPGETDRLLEELLRWREENVRASQFYQSEGRGESDPSIVETERKLRALGYID